MSRTKSGIIALSAPDRQILTGLVRRIPPGPGASRARILLALDENFPDRDGPVPAQAVVAEPVCVRTWTEGSPGAMPGLCRPGW